MSLSQADTALTGERPASNEIETLQDQIAGLTRATISISETSDTDAALQEIIKSA